MVNWNSYPNGSWSLSGVRQAHMTPGLFFDIDSPRVLRLPSPCPVTPCSSVSTTPTAVELPQDVANERPPFGSFLETTLLDIEFSESSPPYDRSMQPCPAAWIADFRPSASDPSVRPFQFRPATSQHTILHSPGSYLTIPLSTRDVFVPHCVLEFWAFNRAYSETETESD